MENENDGTKRIILGVEYQPRKAQQPEETQYLTPESANEVYLPRVDVCVLRNVRIVFVRYLFSERYRVSH